MMMRGGGIDWESVARGMVDFSTPFSIPAAAGAACGQSYAFAYRGNLVGVELGNATAIGEYAFYNCSGLASLELPSTLLTIGNNAFDGCNGMTGSLVLPSSLTTIGQYAFRGCNKLTGSIVVPESVTSVGRDAFTNCTSLDGTATVGNLLTAIPNSMFDGCKKLKGIDIGSGVTSIGNTAFDLCTGLQYLIFRSVTPPTLGTNSLYRTNNCAIYVPDASVSTYKSSWSSFAARIYGLSELV